MRLTPDTFVKTDFGLGVGLLFLALGVFSLIRGRAGARRSPTGTVLAIASCVVGGYIAGRYFGYIRG